MEFEFYSSTRIIFGKGTISKLNTFVQEMGTKALVITGKSVKRASIIFDILKSKNIPYSRFIVEGEPTVGSVSNGLEQAKGNNIDFVIGIGGGSVLDTGKAIASLLTNKGEITDYLEVIGKGKPITKPGLPYIAIPTTAGTGTEVTRNAVLAVPEQKVKVSLRSQYLLPKISIVDAQLTYELPPDVTARTGLDAFSQVIEPYTSNQTNPIVDGFCREGIHRAARSLIKAYQDGSNEKAREDMCIASLLGGLALANGKLGAVHGIAGPMGGMFPIPHGTVCACLLPYAMEVNMRALRKKPGKEETLERYCEIARIITGKTNARIEDGIIWVKDLCQQLHIPRLAEFGITSADFPELIQKSLKASSMKGNPIQLTVEEVGMILEGAL